MLMVMRRKMETDGLGWLVGVRLGTITRTRDTLCTKHARTHIDVYIKENLLSWRQGPRVPPRVSGEREPKTRKGKRKGTGRDWPYWERNETARKKCTREVGDEFTRSKNRIREIRGESVLALCALGQIGVEPGGQADDDVR